MSFSGSVSRESHEGGLLVSFEGRAPGLYTGIRIVGGKFLGRVDSVIGPVNNAYIHIKPLAENLVLKNTIGSPVEIAPRDRRPRNDRDRNRRNNTDRNSNLKPGDWMCPKCKNHNYANKQVCNRSNCNEKKPRNNHRRNERSNGRSNGRSDGSGRNTTRRQTNRQSKPRSGNGRQSNNSRNGKRFNSRK